MGDTQEAVPREGERTDESPGTRMNDALLIVCIKQQELLEAKMDRNLAIITGDVIYGRALADYFSESKLINYRVNVFYDVEDYLEFADKAEVSVLLLDDKYRNAVPDGFARRYILTEKRTGFAGEIFKYQSMEILVKEVNFLLHEDIPKENEGGYRYKTYCVGGNHGGSGASSFALCVSEILGAKESTLFLCLDPFWEAPGDMEVSEGGVTELIYALKVYGNRWMDKAAGFIRHGRYFDYITGFLSFSDLADFDESSMRNFFLGLGIDGRYKNLCIDLGAFPKGALIAAEKCERMYITGVTGENIVSIQLKRSLGDEAAGKIIELMLPADDKFSGKMPNLHDFENTKLYEYAGQIIKNGEQAFIGSNECSESKKPLVASEPEIEYSPIKSKILRLVEKGFMEGRHG